MEGYIVSEIWRHSESLATVESILYRAVIWLTDRVEAKAALREHSNEENTSGSYIRVVLLGWVRAVTPCYSPNHQTVFNLLGSTPADQVYDNQP